MARKTAPIISNDNTVRVKHGHNFENKSFSEHLCGFLVTYQVLNEPLDNERTIGFSRMDSSTQNNALSSRDMIL